MSKREKLDAVKAEAKAEKAKAKAQEFLGTGRRKCSVARVRITTGTGNITINGVDIGV